MLIHTSILPWIKTTSSTDHIFAGYLFLCLIDAYGKTSLLGLHQLPLDPGQIELLQTFCDHPMIPDPSKQGQHAPDIDKCGLGVLTGHKVPQHKVNNVTSVLKSSKPNFSLQILQSVAANTPFPDTRSPYCMHQFFHCHSNLVTTPSSLSSFAESLLSLANSRLN